MAAPRRILDRKQESIDADFSQLQHTGAAIPSRSRWRSVRPEREGSPGLTAWAFPNRSSLRLLTFYSEGPVRTAYAAHCIQRGASRLAFLSLKVCCRVFGHPPARRRRPSLLRIDCWR
jgi:hypothetical protein